MTSLNDIRAAFPHTEDTIYMNHAAMAPVGRHVKEAVEGFLAERQHTNIENYFEFLPIVKETKEFAAKILHTRARDIAFVSNTSSGLNILAQGLDWKEGDRILIPGCEFPANVYPFMALKEKGVRVDLLPHNEGTFAIDDIEKALTPRTRLLSLSWVQFLSGFKADLKAIGSLCKSKNILFCVDAIQGLGALQIDVKECQIDFLASGGHKWIMSLQGIGLVYVAEALRDQLYAPAGWLHGPIDWENLTDYNLAFHNDARRFRLGTQNAVGIAALHAALTFYLEAEPAWCEAQVLANASQIRDGLKHMGFEVYGGIDIQSDRTTSGIVTVKHSGANEMFEALKSQSIHIAVRNGLLRFSPTYYNSAHEIEIALEQIEKLLAVYPV